MNKKFRRWVTEGRIPPFWGTFAVNIRDLPEDCAIEAVSLLKKNFVKLVSDANKQIKNTKRLLGMPAARGLLVFLQSGDYFLPPNTILNLVNRCLPDQHNRSVDDVIHANADLAAIQPSNGDRHAFFLHACRDVQNPISLDLEPIPKLVESGESVVIRYVVSMIEGSTTCGRQNTADWRSSGACSIPAI
jgi:hypothetical protein